MTTLDRKHAFKRDMMVAGLMIAAGFALCGVAVAQLSGHPQLAQATPPLQSTPGADTRPSTPSEPSTTGTGSRPADIAPEPARPDSEAQKTGAEPALPPAPAEKTGDPIRPKT